MFERQVRAGRSSARWEMLYRRRKFRRGLDDDRLACLRRMISA